MDASVKTAGAVSETILSSTTSNEKSNIEGQKVKTHSAEKTESGDTMNAAKDIMQSSSAVARDESHASQDLPISQDGSNMADKSADKGKLACKQDSVSRSMCKTSNNESGVTKDEILVVLQDSPNPIPTTNVGEKSMHKTGANDCNFWPPTATGAWQPQVGDGKETGVRPKSPGSTAEPIKANIVEEMEMIVLQSTSQGSASADAAAAAAAASSHGAAKPGGSSQPPHGNQEVDKLVNIVGAQIKCLPTEFAEKNKQRITPVLHSSSPCLSPTAKEAEKLPVLQKATSYPVLPIIKITEPDDVVEEEARDASADERSVEAVKVIEKIRKLPKSEPVQSAGISAVEAPKSAEFTEEENAAAVKTCPPANEEPEGAAQNREKPFFYVSSSEIPAEYRYRTSPSIALSEAGSSACTPKRSERHTCLGSRSLHAGIVVCCIVIASIGMCVYSSAHFGEIAEVYQTIGLSCFIIAFVIGLFSTLYITYQLCFPNPPNSRQKMEDIETALLSDGTSHSEDSNHGVPARTVPECEPEAPSATQSCELVWAARRQDEAVVPGATSLDMPPPCCKSSGSDESRMRSKKDD